MIYSVWNQSKKLYDYYETAETQKKANAPTPKHLRSSRFGLTVPQSAWKLPKSAKYAGSGDQAKGRVASPPGLGAVGFDTNMIGLIGLGLVAFILLKGKVLD